MTHRRATFSVVRTRKKDAVKQVAVIVKKVAAASSSLARTTASSSSSSTVICVRVNKEAKKVF
jgi:hypothetical protein